MAKKIAFVLFLLLFSISSADGFEDISFKGTDKSSSGDLLTLTGKLYKPQGNGPFPAVILMHGCNGVAQSYISWAEKVTSWGYVSLVLDSFTPRGHGNICGASSPVPYDVRVADAFDAKAHLAGLPFVNPRKLALVGYSHGGCSALACISQANLTTMFNYQGGVMRGGRPQLTNYFTKGGGPFQAVIAFYPWCAAGLDDSESPLLILFGEKDTWLSPISCQLKLPSGKTKHEIILKIYDGATHGFDMEGPERISAGHKIIYDPQATADATDRVRAFLKKYLQE